jgi:hypothetical protein
MRPSIGKFYYINYEDKENPKGSYFGIARCVATYERNENGEQLVRPLYEFEHPQDDKMVLSLFFDDEVVMEAK